MNRCITVEKTPPPRATPLWRSALFASFACAALLPALPCAAQVQPGLGLIRPFPEAALRGTLVIESSVQAQLNGQTIRIAPGMRLFSPQNSLILMHTVLGKPFKVNYVLEVSTGMLHAAWILTEAEAAQPRKSSDATVTNIRSEWDAARK